MKICICGSIAFYDQMLGTKAQLEKLGHSVTLPPSHIESDKGMMDVREYYAYRKTNPSDDWVWEQKTAAIRRHFDKIAACEAIIVLNEEKKGVPGYIGGNTLIEIGVAFYLHKKIFLMHPIPQQDIAEEVKAMGPQIVKTLNDLH